MGKNEWNHHWFTVSWVQCWMLWFCVVISGARGVWFYMQVRWLSRGSQEFKYNSNKLPTGFITLMSGIDWMLQHQSCFHVLNIKWEGEVLWFAGWDEDLKGTQQLNFSFRQLTTAFYWYFCIPCNAQKSFSGYPLKWHLLVAEVGRCWHVAGPHFKVNWDLRKVAKS